MAAATVTAVAAGITAVATVGGAVYGAVKSNKAAKEARKDQKAASKAASKAYKQARKGMDINFYEGLSVNKTPYELEREAMLSTSANLIDAAEQGDSRGVGAVASRILLASQKGQQATTGRMSQEMAAIEEKKRNEDARLRDVLSDLSVQEAGGAQVASANAANRAAQHTTNMHSSIQQGISGLGSLVPLYGSLGGGVTPGVDPYTSSTYQDFLPQGGHYTGGGMPGVTIDTSSLNN